MQDLNDKAIDGTLTNVEWNGRAGELQKIVEAWAALSGSGGDDQLGQAIAAYASASQFYTCSGPADAYIATVGSGIQAPPSYADGMVVRVRSNITNTGAATVNVAGIGIKDIKREDGTTLQAGDLSTTRDAWMVYDGTDFLLQNFSSLLGQSGDALDPGLSSCRWIRTDDKTLTLQKGMTGSITVVIDGVKLTSLSNLVFILDDFGVGGSVLDTGSETASTAYYMYLENVAGVLTPRFSLQTPQLPGDVKPGYGSSDTDWRCFGGIWNDVSENLVKGYWDNSGNFSLTSHDTDHESRLSSASASANWISEILNVPKTVSEINFILFGVSTITATILYFGASDAITDPTIYSITDSNSVDVIASLVFSGTAGDFNHGLVIMPIADMTTPAFKYHNLNLTLTGAIDSVVTKWHDIFAPRF